MALDEVMADERGSTTAGQLSVDAVEPITGCARPLRADAARNRSRILEAAEEVFAEDGIAVPVDVVAERAGVGVGTLYRHFPTKEALFEAIVVNRLCLLIENVKTYEEREDAAEALFAFLHEFGRQAAAKQDLFDALGPAELDVKQRCASQLEEMRASIKRLYRRAADAGTVRGDVDADDLIGLVVGASHAANHAAGRTGRDEARTDRMVAVICSGLRT
jgi:AcrR family transcriptional regulator